MFRAAILPCCSSTARTMGFIASQKTPGLPVTEEAWRFFDSFYGIHFSGTTKQSTAKQPAAAVIIKAAGTERA